MSAKRRKMTREERAKREVKRARRKLARKEVKEQMEAAVRERRRLEERAERSGIQIAKSSDIENIPKENLK